MFADFRAARVAKHEEYVVDLIVLSETDKLILTSGKRSLNLSFVDLAAYQGERGRRGNKLPRGLQSVDSVRISS
jgi:topoisomerase-4 subunit A